MQIDPGILKTLDSLDPEAKKDFLHQIEYQEKYSNPYFENITEIEDLWKKAKLKEFQDKIINDKLIKSCNKGQLLIASMINYEIGIIKKEKKKLSCGFVRMKNEKFILIIKTIPAYQRAIMLLEKEAKRDNRKSLYQQAIKLCNVVKSFNVNTDWYDKRLISLQKIQSS